MDVAALSKLTTSIHADILVGTLWGVAGEPAVDPIDGRCFRCEGATKDTTTEVISQKDIASLSVEADERVVPSGIATLLDHKTEINRQSLITRRRSHRGSKSFRCLAEFGSKAYGTPFKLGWDLELWHPFYETMHFRQPTKVDVPEALVPQHSQSRTTQGAHGIRFRRDRRGEFREVNVAVQERWALGKEIFQVIVRMTWMVHVKLGGDNGIETCRSHPLSKNVAVR
jgi:hypothetical protein